MPAHQTELVVVASRGENFAAEASINMHFLFMYVSPQPRVVMLGSVAPPSLLPLNALRHDKDSPTGRHFLHGLLQVVSDAMRVVIDS